MRQAELLQNKIINFYEVAQKMLDENVEQFRANAFEVSQSYTPHDRKVIKALCLDRMESYHFFQCWHDEIRIPLRNLRKPLSATLVRSLSNTLTYSDRESKDLANALIETRERELVKKITQRIYGDTYRKSQRSAVISVLSKKEDDIEALYLRYIEWKTYAELAKDNRISLYDPYTSWVKRRSTSAKIKKENKKLLQKENERIASIDQKLQILYVQDDNLISHIKATNIDIVTIVAVKTEYEKQLQRISEADRHNPVIRTNIYKKATEGLREAFGEKYKNCQIESLKESQRIVNDIDTVLIRVFDLSNSKKNQLMADMKTVRELLKEKEAIENGQIDRLKVAKRTLWH